LANVKSVLGTLWFLFSLEANQWRRAHRKLSPCKPGDERHLTNREAVSACRAFRNKASRSEHGTSLSDIEDRFVCTACGKRGADVRPDFHWDRPGALARGL
jgi:hypothetical protein